MPSCSGKVCKEKCLSWEDGPEKTHRVCAIYHHLVVRKQIAGHPDYANTHNGSGMTFLSNRDVLKRLRQSEPKPSINLHAPPGSSVFSPSAVGFPQAAESTHSSNYRLPTTS